MQKTVCLLVIVSVLAVSCMALADELPATSTSVENVKVGVKPEAGEKTTTSKKVAKLVRQIKVITDFASNGVPQSVELNGRELVVRTILSSRSTIDYYPLHYLDPESFKVQTYSNGGGSVGFETVNGENSFRMVFGEISEIRSSGRILVRSQVDGNKLVKLIKRLITETK